MKYPIHKVALAILIRAPIVLFFFALIAIGRWAERTLDYLEEYLPGLERK